MTTEPILNESAAAPPLCPVCEKACNVDSESDTVSTEDLQEVRRLAATSRGNMEKLERLLKELDAKLKN